MPEADTETSLAHAGSGGQDVGGRPLFLGARNWVARYLENAEWGMGKEKWQITNAGWQMTNAGWQMGDDKCRDETDHPRFPGAKKWVASSAIKDGMPQDPLLTRAMIRGPDGGKMTRKGVEMAIFLGIGYVNHNDATPVTGYS